MKYLTVVRHGKSSWDVPGVADHDRPLNERGQQAVPAVATFLHRTYFGGGDGKPMLPPPDQLLSSTARRALTTAEMMREVMKMPPKSLVADSKLYLAEAPAILEVARGLDEGLDHVMIFGHNPGLHEFAERILARAHVSKMPTCTCVLMALPYRYWGLADWGEAQLIGYITPKSLERRFPDLYAGISRPGEGDGD